MPQLWIPEPYCWLRSAQLLQDVPLTSLAKNFGIAFGISWTDARLKPIAVPIVLQLHMRLLQFLFRSQVVQTFFGTRQRLYAADDLIGIYTMSIPWPLLPDGGTIFLGPLVDEIW